VLGFDLIAARVHARLAATLASSGTPVGAHDLIIGATALGRGLGVVTRDPRSFPRIPGLSPCTSGDQTVGEGAGSSRPDRDRRPEVVPGGEPRVSATAMAPWPSRRHASRRVGSPRVERVFRGLQPRRPSG
jgi:hypothetical protein